MWRRRRRSDARRALGEQLGRLTDCRPGEDGRGGGGGGARDGQSCLDALEVLDELLGGLIAVLRVLGQGAQDDLVELRRYLRPQARGRLRQLVHVLHGDLDRRVAGERHLAGQHLVEHDAGRVEVGGGRHRRAARLLGREVLRGAHDRAGLGHLRGAVPRDPEVGHLQPRLVRLHLLVGGDEDVVRLDVAMDDPVAVREAEGLEELLGVPDRGVHRERAVGHDQLLEAAALDHLHRDVVRPLGLAAVVDGDDVRVREAGGRLRLAAEALDEEVVAGVALVEDLDRDAAPELLVLGEVDVGHPAGAELAQDPVATVEERVDQGVREARHGC